jgi:hypothetical protein
VQHSSSFAQSTEPAPLGNNTVDTQSCYRLVTLMSFGRDDKPRSRMCTHSEHQARTIKILQSMCVSHKIVVTYRKQHAPRFEEGKTGYRALISSTF